MPYAWPEDTDFALRELDVLDRDCPTCGRMMHVCDHRYRRFHTLEVRDDYGIRLSADSLARYIQHYQVRLAARQEDPEALRRQDQSVGEIILAIDGLQPEKGHETLSVVRELTQKRI